MDDETLWAIALNGSPAAAAIALAILDYRLGGKISELKKRLDRMNVPETRVRVPAGAKLKGGV